MISEAGATHGSSAATVEAVLSWTRSAPTALAEPGDDLDDIMISSTRSYHLVRPVSAGADPRPLLVYLRLDRRRANLATARRELSRQLTALTRPAPPAAAPLPRRSASTRPAIPACVAPRVGADGTVVAIPLPRRPDPAGQPAAAHPAPQVTAHVPSVLPQGWTNDLDTLRRLASALRRSA